MNFNTRAIGAMIVVSLAVGILAVPRPALASQPADRVEPSAPFLPSSDSNAIALAADDSTEIGSVPIRAAEYFAEGGIKYYAITDSGSPSTHFGLGIQQGFSAGVEDDVLFFLPPGPPWPYVKFVATVNGKEYEVQRMPAVSEPFNAIASIYIVVPEGLTHTIDEVVPSVVEG